MKTAIRFLIPVALLTFYLVPNTILANASPLTWSILARTGTDNRTLLTVLSVLCLLGLAPLVLRMRASGAQLLYGVLIVYMLTAAASASLPGNSLAGANDCFGVLLALTVGMVSAALVPTPGLRVAAIGVLTVAEALFAVWMRFHGQGVFMSGHVSHAGGTFGNFSLLYTAMAAGLPVLVVLGCSAKTPMAVGLWSIGSAICFGALVLTWSLVAVVAAAIAAFYGLSRFLKDRQTVIATSAVMICLVGLYVAGTPGGVPRIADAMRGRGTLAASVFNEAAWSGSGVGNANIPGTPQANLGQKRAAAAYSTDVDSLPVLWMAELGLVGLALYALFATGVVRAAISARSPEEVAISAGLVGLLAMSAVSSPFATAANPCGTALLGYLIASVTWSRRDQPVREETALRSSEVDAREAEPVAVGL